MQKMVDIVCAACGKTVRRTARSIYCFECSAEIKRERDRARHRKEAIIEAAFESAQVRARKAAEAHRQIIDMNREARSRGLSYGAYVAMRKASREGQAAIKQQNAGG